MTNLPSQPAPGPCEPFLPLLIDHLDGRLAEEDAGRLERHLASCPACRAELHELEATWALLGRLPAGEPGPAVRERFASLRSEVDHEPAWPTPGVRSSRHADWRHLLPRLAAAGLLLATGFLAGRLGGGGADGTELAKLRSEVHTLTGLVSLSLLDQGSAAARLQGVSFGRRLADADEQVHEALLRTATADPSATVRAAAVEALGPAATRPEVRRTLVGRLEEGETSPLVQIALIDCLLADGGPGSTADPTEAAALLALLERERGSVVDPDGLDSGGVDPTQLDSERLAPSPGARLDPAVRDYLERRLATRS
jgi:hypothetical protein